MAYTLPPRIQNLEPYAPLEGDFPIRLDANESFLTLPASLRKELAEVVARLPLNRYPDPRCRTLCDAFASYYSLPDGDNVVAGNGSDELIGLLVGCFVRPGTPVAVTAPDFSMYRFYAQLSGAPVAVFDKAGLGLDVAALLDFCRRQQPSLLLLSNPCNPTSLLAGRAAILQVVEALPDCLVVVDEAYMDFAGESVLDVAQRYDNLVVLRTCSKALGLAGIRLGFAVAAPMVARALLAVKSPYNVSALTQAVGELLLRHPDYLRDCAEKIRASRDNLYAGLRPLVRPTGLLRGLQATHANFVFVELPDEDEAEETFLLAAREGIALRRMGRYLRITAGNPQENKAVLTLLETLTKE